MDTTVQDLAQAVAAEVVRQVLAQLEGALRGDPAPMGGALPGQRAAPPPDAVFRREGAYWTLAFEDHLARVRDGRGMQHLGSLLARPNQPVHVLELAGAASVPHADGLPVLDARAKAEYRRRLAQLEDDLGDARERGDERRAELVAVERDFLVRELSRALGLSRRDRTTGGAAERARVAVTKSPRRAVDAVEEHHRPLGAHLRRTVRTGLMCTYCADPAPVWVR